MAYEIEGRLLEVCTCNVLCPCWVGEDPDYKTCDTAIAWGIEKGSIEGVDVAGLTMAVSAHIPGNILIPKSWKAVVFVDDARDRRAGGRDAHGCSPASSAARSPTSPASSARSSRSSASPITFTRRRRQGPADDRRRSSTPTWRRSWARPASRPTLAETVFSTIPGSPVYASKAEPLHAATAAPHGIPSVDLQGHNALQGHFRFAA